MSGAVGAVPAGDVGEITVEGIGNGSSLVSVWRYNPRTGSYGIVSAGTYHCNK